MTKEEIERRIEELEDKLFMLNMKDTWNGDDYAKERQYEVRINELKKELEVVT